MTLFEFMKLNKEILDTVEKCYKLFEKLGWEKTRFSFVNKAEEESEKLIDIPLEDLKKKKEELGSQAFSKWLRRPEYTLKNLKERYLAWNKLYEMKIEDERKADAKKRDIKEDIMNLARSV